MEFENNKISQLIEGQLPNFLQEEGPKFIKFVENYYEWMETSKLEISIEGDLDISNIPQPLRIRGYNSQKDIKNVYANVLNIYPLDNGNYVFYVTEYSKDPNNILTRGFSSDDDVRFIGIDDENYNDVELKVVSYIQNASLSSKNLWNLQDIDRTLDEYVDFFMKEYLKGFPITFPTQEESLDIDVDNFKKFLVKHSREFYQSKGTEDSFKYFFRTIFNEEVSVIYPKHSIMKASNNTFDETFTVLLKPNNGDILPDIVNKKIIGESSLSESYVESVIYDRMGPYEVLKVELNKRSLNGEFNLNENVLDSSGNIIGSVYFCGNSVEIISNNERFLPNQRFFITRDGQSLEYKDISNTEKGSFLELIIDSVNDGEIKEIKVNEGGLDHTVGEKITFDNTGCFFGEVYQRPLLAYVSEVDSQGKIISIEVNRVGRGYVDLPRILRIGDNELTDESFEIIGENVGTIKSVLIKNQGVGYNQSEIDVDLNSTNQNNLKIKFGSVFNDNGNFINQESFLSNIKVMQDSKYYQSFSYVLESSIQLYKFRDLLKSLIHPAGMQMFGTIKSENLEDCKMVSSQSILKIPFILKKVVGNYSDIVLKEFGMENFPIIEYNFGDGESGSVPPEEPFEYILDGGSSISESSDFYINSVSSWDSLHQIYKHKYMNLTTGVNDVNNFKFKQIKGIKVSVGNDQKLANYFRTYFIDIVKQDERDFIESDFKVGDSIYQGSPDNKTLESTVESWDHEKGQLEILVLNPNGSPDIDGLFYKETDLNLVSFNIINIVERFDVQDTRDLIIGDFLYQGNDLKNPQSFSEISNINQNSFYLNTTLGNFNLGKVKTVKNYTITNSNLNISFNKNKDDNNDDIEFSDWNFSVGDDIYQINDDEEIFKGSVLSWNHQDGEVEFSLTSGRLDPSLPIKKITTNYNNVQERRYSLFLEKKSEPFNFNQFLVDDVISQGDVQSTVYNWESFSGILDVINSTDDFLIGQNISNRNEEYNLRRIYRLLIVEGVENDIFSQRFQKGDIVFQVDSNDNSLKTSQAEVVSWNSSSGELLLDTVLPDNVVGSTNTNFDVQKDIKIERNFSIENYNIILVADRFYIDRNKIDFDSGDFNLGESLYQYNDSFNAEVDDWKPNTGELIIKNSSGFLNSGSQILKTSEFITSQDNGYEINSFSEVLIISPEYNSDYNIGEKIYQGDSLESNTALGEVLFWDSSDRKLEILKESGNFEIDQQLKKEYDSYEFELEDVQEFIEGVDFQVGDVFYQGLDDSIQFYDENNFKNKYTVQRIDEIGNKIYVQHIQDYYIRVDEKISKEYLDCDIISIHQSSLFLDSSEYSFLNNETVYQGDSLNSLILNSEIPYQGLSAKSRVKSWNRETRELELETSENFGSFSVDVQGKNDIEYVNFEIDKSEISTEEIKFGDEVSLMNSDGSFNELFRVLNVNKTSDQFTVNINTGKSFELASIFRREYEGN